ncbi:hypothetical protein [Hydrogenimonas sp.]
MKRIFFISLLAITILPGFSYADYTRGVYGKLEYVLMHDSISDKYNNTDRKSFIQNYQIGYEHYIYSPRLLTYDLGLSLYIDNTTSDVSNSGTTTKSKNETKHTNYKAYLNFIKKSKFPFTIYYEKIDSPLWSTAPDGTTLITYKTDKGGIYGRMKLEAFNLHYEYRQSKTHKNESFAYENGDTKRFAIGIDKNFDENRTASFNYSHEIRDYYRSDNGLNYTDSWNDVVDNAVATYSWIISKTLSFATSVNYLKNEYLEYEDLTGTASLNWTPSKKHSETFSIVADNTKTRDGTNNFISLNESGSYNITDNFTTNHGFQLYNASGDLYNMTLASATVGTSYLKRFSETFNASFGASVTGRTETYDYSDQNITIQDRNMLSYTLSSSVSKSFDEKKSSLTAGLSYYQLISTTSDATQRITLNAGYNKKFSDQLSYYFKLYSTHDNNTYTTTDNNETNRVTNILSIDNALSYWRAVGFNGKMTLKAGVIYSAGTFINRVNPYGNFSFFYMLRRDLMFKMLARVSTDTGYNVTSYTGSADLIYRIRKIEMRTGIQMSRQTGGTFGYRDHMNYFFRISRRI